MITPQTKILVTGCGGMLGEAVYAYFKDKCQLHPTDSDVNESWLTHLDVTDHGAVRAKVLALKPDYIFHLAALTDLEYCEQNPLQAYKTNALATEHITLLCRELDISLVYITTAGAFDGQQERCTDYDIPNPLNVYGKSKYAGERFVQEMWQKHFIFRVGWMIGGGPKKDKKFVNKIVQQIKGGAKELFVVDDKFGVPTYTYDFVKILHEMVNKKYYGLCNAVCEGSASRYDVAYEIVNIKKLQDKVKITKVDSSHFRKEYFAPRPTHENLLNVKLQMLGIVIPRDWKMCLQDYFNRHNWDI